MRVAVHIPDAPYWQATLFMDEPTHVGVIIETMDGLATLRGWINRSGVPGDWDGFTNRYPGDYKEKHLWQTEDVSRQMGELVVACDREAARMMGIHRAV